MSTHRQWREKHRKRASPKWQVKQLATANGVIDAVLQTMSLDDPLFHRLNELRLSMVIDVLEKIEATIE